MRGAYLPWLMLAIVLIQRGIREFMRRLADGIILFVVLKCIVASAEGSGQHRFDAFHVE